MVTNHIFKLGLWADASHGSTRLTFFNSFIVHWCWFSLSITQIKFCVAISMYCSISNCLAIMHHIQDYFCPQIMGFSEIFKKSYVGQIIWNGKVNWYCHRKFISCDTQRESTTMHNKKFKKYKPRTAVQSIGPQTKWLHCLGDWEGETRVKRGLSIPETQMTPKGALS